MLESDRQFMRTLHHHTLLAGGRKVRLALGEKRLAFSEVVVEPWRRDENLLVLNPAGELPVLVDEDGSTVCGAATICEYLDEVYPEPPLLGRTPVARAEARRLAEWFDGKFHREVAQHLAGEKLLRRVSENAAPDSRALKAGRENIHTHLHYIAWLTERHSWLAADHVTVADLSAAAAISLVDYSGDVPWDDHPLAKEWYVRFKSRPGFRPLLRDVVANIPPAPVYANLDF
jgi:glutathione S-transferase